MGPLHLLTVSATLHVASSNNNLPVKSSRYSQRYWSMPRLEWWLPLATLLVLTLLQWRSHLEVAAAALPEDCVPRELRCELLCHVVELGLQCAKCRSRAPVRFGKRVPEIADNFLQAPAPACCGCGHLLHTLLRKAAAQKN